MDNLPDVKLVTTGKICDHCVRGNPRNIRPSGRIGHRLEDGEFVEFADCAAVKLVEA